MPLPAPGPIAPRVLGGFFVLAGTLHFTRPRRYEAIMPPYVPAQREMVYLSGVAEIVGGLAALAPRTRPFAGWWLIATLVAVFPANVDMALRPDDYPIRRSLLYARLPFQAAFVAWAHWATGGGARAPRWIPSR